MGATAANEHSSRSHMVFMLAICGSHAANGQSIHGACRLRQATLLDVGHMLMPTAC